MKDLSRRNFISQVTKASLLLAIPAIPLKTTVRFGVIADVHHDLIPDGRDRLDDFLTSALSQSPDFLVQMGDFCFPLAENRSFVDAFNGHPTQTYHVLGNHDMDLGFSREETTAFWGMEAKYYSFETGGIRFVVLDGNDPNPPPFEGYPRYIGHSQLEWLKNELENTRHPVIMFSHQSLENQDGGVDNCSEVRKVLERHNKSNPEFAVLACLSGHHHTDYVEKINDIYYIQINSASYRWVGEKYKARRFSEQLHSTYKWLDHMIPYKEALYTFISVEPTGFIRIEGRRTNFVSPGPEELGIPDQPINNRIVPYISESKLSLI